MNKIHCENLPTFEHKEENYSSNINDIEYEDYFLKNETCHFYNDTQTSSRLNNKKIKFFNNKDKKKFKDENSDPSEISLKFQRNLYKKMRSGNTPKKKSISTSFVKQNFNMKEKIKTQHNESFNLSNKKNYCINQDIFLKNIVNENELSKCLKSSSNKKNFKENSCLKDISNCQSGFNECNSVNFDLSLIEKIQEKSLNLEKIVNVLQKTNEQLKHEKNQLKEEKIELCNDYNDVYNL